jgi:hypothetical protein
MTPKETAYHKALIKENYLNDSADKITCIHIAIEYKYNDLAIELIKLLPKPKIVLSTLSAAEFWGELTTRKGTIAAFRQHIMNLGYKFPAKDKIVPKNGLKAEYTFKGVCDFAIATLKH